VNTPQRQRPKHLAEMTRAEVEEGLVHSTQYGNIACSPNDDRTELAPVTRRMPPTARRPVPNEPPGAHSGRRSRCRLGSSDSTAAQSNRSHRIMMQNHASSSFSARFISFFAGYKSFATVPGAAHLRKKTTPAPVTARVNRERVTYRLVLR
jgi:hypothetical protein